MRLSALGVERFEFDVKSFELLSETPVAIIRPLRRTDVRTPGRC